MKPVGIRAEGSDDAEELVRYAIGAYGASVYRFVFGKIQNRQYAEDVCQEVFTALYYAGVEFCGDEHLKAWLFKVASNRCKNAVRTIMRRREQLCDSIPETSMYSYGDVAGGRSCIWDMVDRLAGDLRAAVYLHYVAGYTTDEISLITATNPSTVRTRLCRARRMLKKMLESEKA